MVKPTIEQIYEAVWIEASISHCKKTAYSGIFTDIANAVVVLADQRAELVALVRRAPIGGTDAEVMAFVDARAELFVRIGVTPQLSQSPGER